MEKTLAEELKQKYGIICGDEIILAVMQNAWGPDMAGEKQNLAFIINPYNKSGKILYKLTQGFKLRVTNVNPIITKDASGKGETDLEFFREALSKVKYDRLIICGKQAEEAYEKVERQKVPTVIMPHPASRNLTNKLLDKIKEDLPGIQVGEIVKYKQNKGNYEVQRTVN